MRDVKPEVLAMRSIHDALFAVLTEDVTKSYGLDKLAISDVTVKITPGWFLATDSAYEVTYLSPARDKEDVDAVVRSAGTVLGNWRYASDMDRARMVRTALTIALQHEIDESVVVNGERVFDPHAPKRWRPTRGQLLAFSFLGATASAGWGAWVKWASVGLTVFSVFLVLVAIDAVGFVRRSWRMREELRR